jgi:sec-independent protein translocase protein TatA
MFPQLGMMEMIVVMGVAVLLFGKRLPEVGRSLGKGIIEFKKGLRGIEDEFDFSSSGSGTSRGTGTPSRRTEDRAHTTPGSSDYVESSVPKFEPPTTAPVPQMEYEPHPTQDRD